MNNRKFSGDRDLESYPRAFSAWESKATGDASRAGCSRAWSKAVEGYRSPRRFATARWVEDPPGLGVRQSSGAFSAWEIEATWLSRGDWNPNRITPNLPDFQSLIPRGNAKLSLQGIRQKHKFVGNRDRGFVILTFELNAETEQEWDLTEPRRHGDAEACLNR